MREILFRGKRRGGVDAVKVMKEVRFDGEDTAGASPRPTRGEVTDA